MGIYGSEAHKCLPDWTSSNPEIATCEVPICFGDKGCSLGGKCITPNYCTCGKLGTQIVGKEVFYGTETGIDCVSLRLDGIRGAFIAMCVLVLAISTCGSIASYKNKSGGLAAHRESSF